LSVIPPTGLTIRLSSDSVTLTGDTTVTLDVDAFVMVNRATQAAAKHHSLFGATGLSLLGCMLLVVVPAGTRRSKYFILAVLLFALLSAMVGCGSSNTQQPPTPPPPTGPVKQAAAKGTYSIVVSATAPNGTVHNTLVTVIVQ
jgi:hypothetical protein